MSTLVQELGAWAVELHLGDVPPPVLELCRAQRRSVLGAVAASSDDAAWGRVRSAAQRWAAPGPAPMPGGGTGAGGVRVEDAVYVAAAASVALDFDDYVCFGHTGHSAVLVPVLLAAETGATGEEQLLAQLVANEIEARLGGACLIGPLNGQLWSFIHSAGAALATGRLIGLDALEMAHALAIALYQPPMPSPPGFFMPDSKLVTASEPVLAGMRAARLAAEGVTGPLDVLDNPRGFFSAFADLPLKGLLGGLGEGWATSTLCVKPYPGCAYIDTALDALDQLGWPAAEEVEAIDVDASILTTSMEAMSAAYVEAAIGAGVVPTPVSVTFSVRWSLAVGAVAGRLTPTEVSQTWLEEHGDVLRRLATKVRVHHDWDLSRRALASFSPVLPPGLVAKQIGVGGVLKAASSFHRSAGRGGLPGRARATAGLRTAGLTALLCRSDVGSNRRTAKRWWDPEALRAFEMAFPARLRVHLHGGRELVAEVGVPRGAAGRMGNGQGVSPCEVARAKLMSYGPSLWGHDGTRDIDMAVSSDDADLWRLLG